MCLKDAWYIPLTTSCVIGLERFSCQRSGGSAVIFAEIQSFFAKVTSISWGGCKVKNKGNSKPEKS